MGCCGSGKNEYQDVYIEIEGKEYYLGGRILSFFLREISKDWPQNTDLNFFEINKKTKKKLGGTIMFKGDKTYINGQRLW